MIVQGKLSIITKGLKDPKEIVEKSLTLNGDQKIGTIIDIDQEKDVYYAEIDNELIGAAILGPYLGNRLSTGVEVLNDASSTSPRYY